MPETLKSRFAVLWLPEILSKVPPPVIEPAINITFPIVFQSVNLLAPAMVMDPEPALNVTFSILNGAVAPE